MTIKELEAQGYEVWVDHYRYGTGGLAHNSYFSKHPEPILPHGGLTYVVIYRNDTEVAFGTARCSQRDNFSKKMGLQIALGRAVAELTGEAKRRRERESNG